MYSCYGCFQHSRNISYNYYCLKQFLLLPFKSLGQVRFKKITFIQQGPIKLIKSKTQKSFMQNFIEEMFSRIFENFTKPSQMKRKTGQAERNEGWSACKEQPAHWTNTHITTWVKHTHTTVTDNQFISSHTFADTQKHVLISIKHTHRIRHSATAYEKQDGQERKRQV